MMSQSENFYSPMIHLFNVSYMLSWVFSIEDCRRCQNLMKLSVTHSATSGLLLFFLTSLWCHLWSVTEQMQLAAWNLSVKLLSLFFFFFQIPVPLITINQSVLQSLLHYLAIIFIQNYGMFLRKEFE